MLLQEAAGPGTYCSALAQANLVFQHIQEGVVSMQGSGFQQVFPQLLHCRQPSPL